MLLAGHDDAAERMTGELERVLGDRVTVVGRCRSTLDEVAAAAGRTEADDVVLLACSHLSPAQMRHLAWRLADQGRNLHLAPGLVGVGGARTHFATHGGLSLVNLQHSELRSIRRSVLQALGRITAGLMLLALAPVLALVALAVRIDSSGPMFFRQQRVGERGRRFTMLKFRTMTDEPAELDRSEDQFLFKLRRDPRVTRVGKVLRRYSLDELPQLVNVFRGEMALVGPRPALPEEAARYAVDVHRRLAVRPGMTGLWQVSGRSDLSWEETVRLDLDYVDNWTPGLDLRILMRTVGAVLGHRGAY
ncbi:exopolysaccharide biosynthesis polyprenyl glycosylphosphotransferase [Nocardioides alcanivorans]|uniref:exopolysaccharide biosynthesis polyprenyl glycosylphosphotransferase n=1 Tax=Nocardioides alcanivorans TaxID=2897352 RepID=UPI001F1ACA65|nr:exopolysaccharide biosynthesis polyprenyl glycosylphosphotransferase [Nocardioides alcanivorans]